MDASSGSFEREKIWEKLPGDLWTRILALVPKNDLTCNLRLVDKAAAVNFNSVEEKLVRLSQPVPHHAFMRRWGDATPWKALTRDRRFALLKLTAASGELGNLQIAVRLSGLFLRGSVKAPGGFVQYGEAMMEAAGAAGQVHICRWLLDEEGCKLEHALKAAAGAGRCEVVQSLLEAGDLTVSSTAVFAAARGGHVGLMQSLLERYDGPRHMYFVTSLLTAAAEGCDLGTLKRVYASWSSTIRQYSTRDRHSLTGAIKEGAARSPTPDWHAKLQWLETLSLVGPAGCSIGAAGLPNAADRLRWLQRRGFLTNEKAVTKAATAGNTSALAVLLGELRINVATSDPACTAARGGHLAALQLLHAAGCPVNLLVIREAAEGGHTAVVAWLLKTLALAVGRLRPGALTNPAASSGSLELLAWLQERRCVFDERTLECAAGSGCEAMVERLVEHGCPVPETGEPLLAAARLSDIAMLRCLRRLGCPWGSGGAEIYTECVKGSLPLSELRWLVAEGCPVNWARALLAAKKWEPETEREEVAAWLREQQQLQG